MTTTTKTRSTEAARALAELRRMLGQPVDRQRADEMDELAQVAGVQIGWKNVDLTTSEEREGRENAKRLRL